MKAGIKAPYLLKNSFKVSLELCAESINCFPCIFLSDFLAARIIYSFKILQNTQIHEREKKKESIYALKKIYSIFF